MKLNENANEMKWKCKWSFDEHREWWTPRMVSTANGEHREWRTPRMVSFRGFTMLSSKLSDHIKQSTSNWKVIDPSWEPRIFLLRSVACTSLVIQNRHFFVSFFSLFFVSGNFLFLFTEKSYEHFFLNIRSVVNQLLNQ